jgi:formylglycine-generating enzyme required for sulfatase activity
MAGNVLEWTDSDSFPYPGNNVAPTAGKIMRGGSFLQPRVMAMTTSRSVKSADYHKEYLGFRCARDAPEK